MAFFKPKALPSTSYGYIPPSGATAHGWKCTNGECLTKELEAVRRWPKACARCGSGTDPVFDQPWEHDAEGVELQWQIRDQPEQGGGFHQDRWQIWQFKDALLREDRTGAALARSSARSYAVDRSLTDSWWYLAHIFWDLVWYELQAGDLDWAADDLIFWLGLSSTDDVDNHNGNRTNSMLVIEMTGRFIAAGGTSHPRMPEIKAGCLKVAEGAFRILSYEQQATVTQLSRM
jgi:hypothetical protein